MRFCFIWMCSFALAAAAPDVTAGDGSRRTVTSVVRKDERTGKLVRSVVVSRGAPASREPAQGLDTRKVVERAARHYNIDPLLIHAMIEVESGYNPYALSPKGAEGLMQLMPSTARRFGVRNSFNFIDNIAGGVRYMRHLIDLFDDERLAIAAYNAGEQAVLRYRGIPPYPETRKYVELVSGKYTAARENTVSGPAAPVREADSYRPIEYFVDEHGRLHIRTR